MIERAPQPYVSVPRTVTMATISCAADDIPGLFDWLAEHGTEPAGPPFLRYNVIDMDARAAARSRCPRRRAGGR